MADTSNIHVESDWVQIADGTQTLLVQARGLVEIVKSAQKPPDTLAGHSTAWLKINPPSIVWARAGSRTLIIITPQD